MLDIRHVLNETCLRLYGHIGYSVRASERCKGYATEQLALARKIARGIGLEKVLICCYQDNPASAKVIPSNGGMLENEVLDDDCQSIVQRYWIDLKK